MVYSKDARREEIRKEEIGEDAFQMCIRDRYFAVLTSMRSVGVMGDSRTYDYTPVSYTHLDVYKRQH